MPVEVKAKGGVENLCPFGCTDAQVNEHGYCKHLVGWSDDNRLMDVRERLPGDLPGERMRRGKKRVPPDDPPGSTIIVERQGSNRVYRRDGKAPLPCQIIPPPSQKSEVRGQQQAPEQEGPEPEPEPEPESEIRDQRSEVSKDNR